MRLTIDGDEAVLSAEPKPGLYAANFVYLGPTWESKVPEILHTKPDGGEMTLKGFTQDESVVTAYRAFIEAVKNGTFKVGAVDE
ncbi:MAG TPA: hypothetical protein IGS37_03845 [Synechococcales cyanobacterium M55_K2018_004]|nr:hypothetical protein [Synechococcales cyanobacterium M55_K2018_004]